MKRPFWLLIGFLMFLVGILSLIFIMVGLKINLLSFIYGKGVFTLLIQLMLTFGGMIIVYMSQIDRDEDAE